MSGRGDGGHSRGRFLRTSMGCQRAEEVQGQGQGQASSTLSLGSVEIAFPAREGGMQITPGRSVPKMSLQWQSCKFFRLRLKPGLLVSTLVFPPQKIGTTAP